MVQEETDRKQEATEAIERMQERAKAYNREKKGPNIPPQTYNVLYGAIIALTARDLSTNPRVTSWVADGASLDAVPFGAIGPSGASSARHRQPTPRSLRCSVPTHADADAGGRAPQGCSWRTRSSSSPSRLAPATRRPSVPRAAPPTPELQMHTRPHESWRTDEGPMPV